MSKSLHRDMTESEFDNGYWYSTELKAFAVSLGIPSASRLRKDQLEQEVRHFLRTGEVRPAKPHLKPKAGPPDSDLGLHGDLPIVRYVNNRATKEFLLAECQRIDPSFRPKSGTRYPLNRWREEQIANGSQITYGDLARKFIELNAEKSGPLRTEHGRYNNFFSDYMAAHQDALHNDVVMAWNELKRLDIPKTYAAWSEYQQKNR